MILFPAIDLKNGKCVRLHQGVEDAVTVFSNEPVEVAKNWEKLGAKWLHIIDLDGAFQGKPVNFELIKQICQAVSIPVQLGGGVRSLEIAKAYIDAGVTRLIIGTMALQSPDIFQKLCQEFPDQIGVSLDVRDGALQVKGWVEASEVKIVDKIKELETQGCAFLIYTDISRDGTQRGVNTSGLSEIISMAKIPVILAGGVADINDLKLLYPYTRRGLQGCISGQAIYAGSLDFAEALSWIAGQN